jgi:signal recognition particle receptor subunit beta
VTDSVHQLKRALGEIPSLLLDAELASARVDAMATVDELEVFVPDPAVIVVVGASGAGKSSIVNAIVGRPVAAVSPLRPTTTAVAAIGGSEASSVAGATEFVLTEAVEDGLVVVDTPPWDMATEDIASVVQNADLAVVVVTPARYGDEQTADALESVMRANDWCLVVNRLPPNEGERDQLLDAIHERLGAAPTYAVVEGEAVELPGIADNVELDVTAVARRTALASGAADAARLLARSLTETATDVGELDAVIASVEPSTFQSLSLDDAFDWEDARIGLVTAATEGIAGWEREVVDRTGSGFSRRIADAAERPDADDLGAMLDAWRVDTKERFRRRSTMWFRKKSGLELLDRWSWMTAVNPSEPLPRRVRRMMRDALEATARKARSDLVAILDGFVARRPDVWRALVDSAGEYRPGMLLAAADAVDPRSPNANQNNA